MINQDNIVNKSNMLYAQAYICKRNQLDIRILKFQTVSEQMLQDICNYYTCLQKYNHPNFQKIIEIKEEDIQKQRRIICVVFERIEGRSLIDLIKHNQAATLNIFNELKSIIDDLYSNTKLIHGNINSSNIVLNNSNKIILINPIPFKQILFHTKDQNFLHKIESFYMAPEIYYKSEYNNKSDYWSIGIILMEMSLGQDITYITKYKQVNHPLINERFPKDELEVCKQFATKISQLLKIQNRGEQKSQEQNFLNILLQDKDGQKFKYIGELSQRQRQLLEFHSMINHIIMDGKDAQMLKKLKYPKEISIVTLNNFENFEILDLINTVNLKILEIKMNKLKVPISQLFNHNFNKLMTLQIQIPYIKYVNQYQFKLISLTQLSLNECKIRNIVFLTKLDAPNLSNLALQNNFINNIEPLYKCSFPKLKQLYLNNNCIIDLKVMNYWEFPVLYQISLRFNPITDLSHIHKTKLPSSINWVHVDNSIIDLRQKMQVFFRQPKQFQISNRRIYDDEFQFGLFD